MIEISPAPANRCRPLVGVLAAVVAMVVVASPAVAADPEVTRLRLAVDRSRVITLPEGPFTSVSVTNPNIADVHVVSPTQILVNAKSPGTTSVVVFYPKRVQFFELAIQPGAFIGRGTAAPDAEPHAVTVQRGDRTSIQLFQRDGDQQWIELVGSRAEPEAARK